VAVSGFGTFEVKKRLERVMVNPATGLRMLVPPKLVLNFKPATMIKVQVKKGGMENG
jgi:SPBc2 prophage-derived DNA-binding protein HU2